MLLGHPNVRLVGNSPGLFIQAAHNESLKFVIEVGDLMLASIPGLGLLSPLSPSPAPSDSTFQVPASLCSVWGGSHFLGSSQRRPPSVLESPYLPQCQVGGLSLAFLINRASSAQVPEASRSGMALGAWLLTTGDPEQIVGVWLSPRDSSPRVSMVTSRGSILERQTGRGVLGL